MAVVKPFICIRPAKENAAKVASLPYDVYNRKEACAAAISSSFTRVSLAKFKITTPSFIISSLSLLIMPLVDSNSGT